MRPFFDEARDEAEAAVAAMREAALKARALHARAELLRHMRLTAEKVKKRPREEAVAFVAREWMTAWRLDDAGYPGLRAEVLAFTDAVRAFVEEPDAPRDAALRTALAALERAFAAHGTTLADEMAWRSECRHGWWEMVRPRPPEVAGADAGEPFWENGCPEHCR